MPIRITQRPNVFDLIQTNGGTIFADIAANPGTTAADVATRTALNPDLVSGVLTHMVTTQMIVCRQPMDSVAPLYWEPGDWAEAIKSNFAAVRTWIDANNNGTNEQMATDLSIHLEVATALMEWFGGTAGAYIQISRV